MKLLLCGLKLDPTKEKQLKSKYKGFEIVYGECEGLDELLPIVFTIPTGQFYKNIDPNQIELILMNNADELKVQTARFFDVEMKKYISESKYRDVVNKIYKRLKDYTEFTPQDIQNELDTFLKINTIKEIDLINSIKMALIKTTKGPKLPELITAFGKKEVLHRLEVYLQGYKHRI